MKAQLTLNHLTTRSTGRELVSAERLVLCKGTAQRLDNARRGTRIHVVSGRVWVTQEKDVEDILLEAGESLQIDRRGAVVVQGLPEAVLQVGKSSRTVSIGE